MVITSILFSLIAIQGILLTIVLRKARDNEANIRLIARNPSLARRKLKKISNK